MPAVLRSRIKSEPEPLDDNLPKLPSKQVGRRQRKRRKADKSDDDENASDSEEEREHSSRRIGNSRPFEMIADLPCSLENAQYNSALTHPLSVKDSAVLYDSLVRSRKTWVLGEMFELYYTKVNKPPKEVKQNEQNGSSPGAIVQVRDKMQKMCDCVMFGGPHTFPVRLFILKNDEIERKWQEEQDMKKKEKDEKRKQEQEDKRRRIEEKKKQQLLKKQEREKMIQLQKENKAKMKMEQEYLKLRRKEEMKKAKEEHKRLKKANSTSGRLSQVSAPRANSSSQSVTDPKMIANLNLMAQRDSKLNSLMAIVAKGDATLDQVEEFKKFIEVAKKMAAPPGWPSQTVGKSAPKKEASAKDTKERSSSVSRSDSNKENADEAMNKADESNKDNHEEKTAGDKETGNVKSSPSVKKEADVSTKSNGRQSQESNDEKSMQLTAFQQKYVEGAQLILEYQEYTHSRYMLPKDAIVEYQEDSGDFIVSWIMIHNEKDISRHRSKRIRELCKGIKEEEEMSKITDSYDVYTERGCPTPLYSSMTIRFSGIQKKFVPIVLNSVNELEKTQKTMTTIIDIGTKLSGYNLWYQLDAYDDKDLAENLRVGLNEHELELKSRKPKK